MTKTKQILQLLALQPALTIDQIAQKLEADLYLTQQLVYKMRSDGTLAVKPLTYSISAQGLARLNEAPKTRKSSPERIKKLVEQQRERNRLRKEREAMERAATTSVQHAIRTQPSSVFALGAM